MSAAVPETYAIIKLGRALTPATTYRLRADSLRSLLGIARSSDRVFITPRPKTDSTRARGDSALTPIADGCTEALASALGEVPTLTVVSPNGLLPYRGRSLRA